MITEGVLRRARVLKSVEAHGASAALSLAAVGAALGIMVDGSGSESSNAAIEVAALVLAAAVGFGKRGSP